MGRTAVAAGFVLSLVWPQAPAWPVRPGPESFAMRVVATDLEGPWEMLWGPDGRLWVTERIGKRVVRIDPATGARSIAATIADVSQRDGQDGLLGMAVAANTVYVAMTYDADPGPGERRRLKVRRYTYDPASETLASPSDVLADLPMGSDHVSGRLALGPDQKLYLTVGDQGNNQLGNFCKPIRAQDLPTAADVKAHDWETYQGKILRINPDGSIPSDNPLLAGVRSHIYTYGHRNAQGLAFGPDGQLYASEHGPSVDDELNLIVGGKNYGWPFVAGYRDDRVYVYARWADSTPAPCATLTFDPLVAPASVPQQKESAWNHPDFMPPLRTFFTVGDDYRFAEQGNATIAPSGIDVYAVRSGGIPGWSNSVLITSLLRGTVYRVKLASSGDEVVGETLEYFTSKDRYRDVVVNPDGRTIYVAADTGSQVHPRSILAFTYQQ